MTPTRTDTATSMSFNVMDNLKLSMRANTSFSIKTSSVLDKRHIFCAQFIAEC